MVKHELVVLAEGLPVPRGAKRRHLAVGHDRQLECVVEARPPPGVALADHSLLLVDEGEAAVEVVADDGEQRVDPAAADDRLREALVHGQCARLLLQLLVGEVGEGGLRDRDKGHLVRDRQYRERLLLRLLDDRLRHLGEAEACAEPEPGEPVLRQPSDVGALRRG